MEIPHFLRRHVLYPLALLRSGEVARLRYLREFERTQYATAEELRSLQEQRLRALIDHAYAHVPFYRARIKAAGLVPTDIRKLEDLCALPILEKPDLQEHGNELLATNWPEHDLMRNQTGGSIGRPVSFFLSRDRWEARVAGTHRHNRWAGLELGDRLAVLWGAPQDHAARTWRARLRTALFEPQLFLDTACITEEKLRGFVEALARFRPKGILAYARAVLLLAKYLQSHGLTAFRPKSIITSAEVIAAEERRFVQDVFGCPIFDRYGCREFSVVASECDRHVGLHTMAEGLHVEIVRGQQPAPAGEPGAILVTDLMNRAMPMIRYRIGDVGSWADGSCTCGRSLPRLRHVEGRVTDFMVGSEGQLVSGVFLATYVVAQRKSLGQVQIWQERRGHVLYRLQPGPGFREADDLRYLTEMSRRFLGPGVAVEFEFVSEFRAEPSGKFLFCKSTVSPDFL
jgi:phenylacetate-CoA ligase